MIVRSNQLSDNGLSEPLNSHLLFQVVHNMNTTTQCIRAVAAAMLSSFNWNPFRSSLLYQLFDIDSASLYLRHISLFLWNPNPKLLITTRSNEIFIANSKIFHDFQPINVTINKLQ